MDDFLWNSSDDDSFSYAEDEAGSEEAAIQAAHVYLNAQRAARFMALRGEEATRKRMRDAKEAGPSGGN